MLNGYVNLKQMAIKTWVDLSDTEKQQIGFMLVSLKEFSYGFDRLMEVAAEVEDGSAIIRFYSNSLYQYVTGYFLLRGNYKLHNILTNLGSDDLLEPIDKLIQTQLGTTTFGDLIRAFRNKFLTHQSFDLSKVKQHVHMRFDIDNPVNAELLRNMIFKLFSETKTLYINLANRYPEALSGGS